MRLADLYRVVLLHVVSTPQYSFLTLALWLCGDPLLQSQLENSVRSINLRDKSQVPLSRWPPLLSRFQKLLSLSVDLENGYLAPRSSDLQLALLSLSPVLESLVVISRDSLFAFNGHAELCATSKSFQHLRKLEIPSIDLRHWRTQAPFYELIMRNIWELSARMMPFWSLGNDTGGGLTHDNFDWPPHLERLNFFTTQRPAFTSHLPASLTSISKLRYWGLPSLMELGQFRPVSLGIQSWTPDFAQLCPDSVTELTANITGFNDHNRWEKSLPPHLRLFELASDDSLDLTDDGAAYLPKSLTKLTGNWNTQNYGVSNLDIDLPNLKSFCTTEHQNTSTAFFRKLPPSMTYLTHDGKIRNPVLDFLPSNLTELNLINMTVQLKAPLSLRSLKSLSLAILSSQLKFLPPSLTHLYWDNLECFDDNLKVLPNLDSLSVEAWNYHHFWALPSSLTSLEIRTSAGEKTNPDVDVAHFAALPPNLKRLKLLNDWVADCHIDSICFSPCSELVELHANVYVDSGITSLLGTRLQKLRYIGLKPVPAERKLYANLPARFHIFQNQLSFSAAACPLALAKNAAESD